MKLPEPDSDGRIPLDNYDEAKAAWMRAFDPLACVTAANPDLPTATHLAYAAKVATEMESILATSEDGTRVWGIALAAEAMFNLTTRHKDPLPSHTVALERGQGVYVPALLAPLLGKSNSEVRRLVQDSAVKVNRKPIAMNVPTTELIGQTINVGKQGTAIAVVEEVNA